MKYYKITIKSFYENNMIATDANGSNISNGDDYFWKMNKGEIIQDAPVFDYFFLESYDKKKFWEWILCDVYTFIGSGSQIRGWFISEDLKLLLENFNLAEPHHFYPSKLMYKGRKLDYYIFQFGGKSFFTPLKDYIQFDKTFFYHPMTKANFYIKNAKEFSEMREKIMDESNNKMSNIPMHKIILKSALDFFPVQGVIGAHLVSERLKQAMETMGITGFEFSELDYEVEIDQ